MTGGSVSTGDYYATGNISLSNSGYVYTDKIDAYSTLGGKVITCEADEFKLTTSLSKVTAPIAEFDKDGDNKQYLGRTIVGGGSDEAVLSHYDNDASISTNYFIKNLAGGSVTYINTNSGGSIVFAEGNSGKNVMTGTGFGINTSPSSSNCSLDVLYDTDVRTGTHGSNCSIYASKATSTQTESIIECRHNNGTQGIGLGYNSISAVGSNASQALYLESKGGSSIYLNENNSTVGGTYIGCYLRNDLRIRGVGSSVTLCDRGSSGGNSISWTTYSYNTGVSDNRYYFYSQQVSAGNKGWISSSGSNSQINFTAQHKCCPKDESKIEEFKSKRGYIVVASGEYYNMFNIDNEDDPTKIQISECLPKFEFSTVPMQKNVFGVIGEFDEKTEVVDVNGEKSYVSKFGWGCMNYGNNGDYEDKPRFKINGGGEGAIIVCNINGVIENGDYITSSAIEGIGMKQDDDILHNYTVAKALNSENFSKGYKIINYNGKNYKYKLIGCSYHCG